MTKPPLNERLFVDYELPNENLSLELALEGRFTVMDPEFEDAPEDDAEQEPQVLIFSTGEMTPFELDFVFADNDGRYRLTAEIDGSLEVTRVGFDGL